MPAALVAPSLLRQLGAIARRLPVPRVRRLHLPSRVAQDCDGNHSAEFCALELDDGAFGLSFLLLDDAARKLLARHEEDAAMPPLAGKDPMSLAAGFASIDAAERAIGLAAINAITHSAWRRLGFEPPPAGNALGGLALEPADHLGMIGAFTPLLAAIEQSGARLTVVELDVRKIEVLREHHPWVTATLDRTQLAGCNKILGTSSMLLNGTLDDMLAICRSASEFVLVGPSAGLWPDALFERGVTGIAGTLVHDGASFAKAMAQGATWRAATRKFAISRQQWPGWQALLGACNSRVNPSSA